MYANIDALEKLTFGWLKNGLRNVKKVLFLLGNPQEKYQVFHIAGTNGKGSVCQMISQVLHKWFGYRVGLTISPHLFRINERIQINGNPISNKNFNRYLGKVFAVAQKIGINLSFFESIIVSALLYFADQKVTYVVVEVGLGGTYDATNVFSHPLATLITTISNDHTDLLWPKQSQILRNKAGILKPWSPCFTGVDTPLMRYGASIKKAPLHICHHLQVTNLLWSHQQKNAWLVYDCLVYLWFDKQVIAKQLLDISHPGRCQRLNTHTLIDGAHNTEGLQALKHYLQAVKANYDHLITIFWSTKTYEQYPDFFAELILGEVTYAVQPDIPGRAVDPESYIHYLPFSVINGGSLKTIWPHLPREDERTLILIYWSLYLIAEVLQKKFKNKMS